MKLASVDEALELAGMKERAGTNTGSTESALELATSRLANSLGTTFEYEERTDYFSAGLINSGSTSKPEYVMNLTKGFVSLLDNRSVDVFVAGSESSESGIGIVKVSDSNVSKMSSVRFVTQLQKGRVILYWGDVFAQYRRTVAVRYTSGFKADTSGVAKGVPEQLKQAALMETLRIIRVAPPVKPKVNDRSSKDELGRMSEATYSSMIRSFLRGANPEMSEVT